MFSGLTNQVSSWMGSAKGEQEEQVPTPTETGEHGIHPDVSEDTSPTKGSKFDMLSNVKSQMTGWLGSGIPSIPGLRKNEAGEAVEPTNVQDTAVSQPVEPVPPASGSPIKQKDDEDNSSATEGADSGPASIAGTPTEEKDGQFDAVSTKALAGAKSIGSFLYSAVNKAGKTVSEAGAKIKKTVGENSILSEFNKEQEAFIKEQQAKNATSSVPPWVGLSNEEAVKEECISLSSDRRNFVRSPPAGVDFSFDYDTSYPVALAIMAEDPNLEKMRFDLVPKIIKEEDFWRNYFYRVSLICQANASSFTGQENPDSINEEEWMKEIDAELKEFEVLTDEGTANSQWDAEMIEQLLEEDDLK